MSAAKTVGLWGPVVLYTGLIAWLSSTVHPIPGMRYLLQMDKLWHLLEYAPYGWLWIRAIRRSFQRLSWGPAAAIAFSAAVFVAILDEVNQSFVPMKFASRWDVLFDAMGAGLSVWLHRLCFPDGPTGT